MEACAKDSSRPAQGERLQRYDNRNCCSTWYSYSCRSPRLKGCIIPVHIMSASLHSNAYFLLTSNKRGAESHCVIAGIILQIAPH